MLYNHGIGLLPSGSLVRDSVEWSFNSIDGHPGLVVLVYANPSESYQLELLLQFWINGQVLSDLMMQERHSHFVAVVVLPKVFAERAEAALGILEIGAHTQDYDLALTRVPVDSHYHFLGCLAILKHC